MTVANDGYDDGDGYGSSYQDGEESSSWFVWPTLLIVSTISFWAQAVVTEERFVPCLNVIANHLQIPDDVAGATLMASGASSPELFAVLVPLFITHSSLGIGTIIGSEVFQQLCIVAAATLSSRTGHLQLNKTTILRELSFYGLSLALLLSATSDRRRVYEPSENDDDDDDDEKEEEEQDSGEEVVYIYVSFTDAALMLGGYLLYVVVCSHFEGILLLCRTFLPGGGSTKDSGSNKGEGEKGPNGGDHVSGHYVTMGEQGDTETASPSSGVCEGAPPIISMTKEWEDPSGHPLLNVSSMPFIRQVEEEPVDNFLTPEHSPPSSSDEHDQSNNNDDVGSPSLSPPPLKGASSVVMGTFDQHDEDEVADFVRHSFSSAEVLSTWNNGCSTGDADVLCMPQGDFELQVTDKERLSPKRKRRRRVLARFAVELSSVKPSKMHGLEEVEVDEQNNSMSCFLWKQSVFYNKARLGVNAWQLRWFTFTKDQISSVPNRAGSETQVYTYPQFDRIDIDRNHLVIKMHRSIPGGPEYVFLAPTSHILKAVVAKAEALMMAQQQQHADDDERPYQPLESGGDGDPKHVPKSATLLEMESLEADEAPSLISLPRSASFAPLFLHCFLFPLKALMHYTIPDVRHVRAESGRPMPTIGIAAAATLSCIVWLMLGSYVMCTSLERIGALLNIPESVLGISVSAIGTSLPMFVASQVAAKQGLGNMAVSNAFGSNTYNILIALGLPWLLYTAFFVPDGDDADYYYHEMRDDGIVTSIFILVGLMLVFVLLLFCSDFVLYPWHAYLFLVTYVVYLGYEIGRVLVS